MSSALTPVTTPRTPVTTPRTAGLTAGTTPRRLRLVEPDERVTQDDWAHGSVFASTRLTRRGRLVVTIVAMVAVAALAVVLATSVDAAAPQVDHATTVSAGQTLSEVAAAHLPNLPIHQGVAQIQLLNGMNTSQVRAGQSLLIPSMP